MVSTYETIVAYLMETYRPDAMIVYGSFADGSANEHSDFDALLMADSEKTHDSAVMDGIVLDVFIYPPKVFQGEYNPADFVQVYDGNILLDKSGLAKTLKDRVLAFIENTPTKTRDEILQQIDWCKKMLARTSRGDAEGYYRWHWLLLDSLEIYMDAKRLYYHGPKKALRAMAQMDAEAYLIYSRALKEFTQETLSQWVACLEGVSLAYTNAKK